MGASTDIVVGGELARAATGRYMATGWLQCGRVWQEPLILTNTPAVTANHSVRSYQIPRLLAAIVELSRTTNANRQSVRWNARL